MIGSEKLNDKQMFLIGVLVVAFIAFLVIVNLLDNRSLNGIKAKKSETDSTEQLGGRQKQKSGGLLSLCHSSLTNGVGEKIFRTALTEMLFRVLWSGAEVQERKLLHL